MKKTVLTLAVALLAGTAAHAGEGPYTDEEIASKFRTMLFGLNKEYNAEPEASRPEGCITFELRILRDGIAGSFRRVDGDFHHHGLLKRIETAVINRLDLPKGRLQEPQTAGQTLCFSHEKGVTSKEVDQLPPPVQPKKAEELMDEERDGLSNRAWLEQLMATEGAPVETTDTPATTTSRPQGTLLSP